jgi:alcohol dehydrogenase
MTELTAANHNHAPETLIERIEILLDLAKMPRHLQGHRKDRNKIGLLADEAARQWTANFNPRPVSKADFVLLYEAAFG